VGWVARRHISPELLGLIGAAWVALFVAPGRRLAALPGEQAFGLADQVASARERALARRLAATRVLVEHSLPVLLVGLGLGVQGATQAASVVALSLAGGLLATWAAPANEASRVLVFALFAGGACFVAGPIALAAAVA